MAIRKREFLQTLFGISEVADRFGVSRDSIKRAIGRGDLQTVNILGRRMIPLREIERAEQYGIGTGRKRLQSLVEAR